MWRNSSSKLGNPANWMFSYPCIIHSFNKYLFRTILSRPLTLMATPQGGRHLHFASEKTEAQSLSKSHALSGRARTWTCGSQTLLCITKNPWGFWIGQGSGICLSTSTLGGSAPGLLLHLQYATSDKLPARASEKSYQERLKTLEPCHQDYLIWCSLFLNKQIRLALTCWSSFQRLPMPEQPIPSPRLQSNMLALFIMFVEWMNSHHTRKWQTSTCTFYCSHSPPLIFRSSRKLGQVFG